MNRTFDNTQTAEMLIEGKKINDLMKENEYLKSLEKKALEIELEAVRLKLWCLDRLLETASRGASIDELVEAIKLEHEVACDKAQYCSKMLIQLEEEERRHS